MRFNQSATPRGSETILVVDTDPETPAAIYVAAFQNYEKIEYSRAILRTPGDPVRLAHTLRERVESLGREYTLEIQTTKEEYEDVLLPERMLVLLTSFFGGAGLLLATIGLYGLLSYTVSRRTNEIGVRIALGATPSTIARLVLREVVMLVVIGLAAGLGIAFASARAIATFLYQLSSHDPTTLALSAAVLVFIAVLASLVPTIRAIRIDPMTALHYE